MMILSNLSVHLIALAALVYLVTPRLRPKLHRVRSAGVGDCSSGCAGCALNRLAKPPRGRRAV